MEINNSNFSTFLWDHKGVIFPLSLALPIAFQVGSIAIKIFKNPSILSNKIFSFQKFVVSSFTQQPNETKEEFKIRLIKNALIVTTFTLGLGAAIACPFCILPMSFAIPIALSVIFLGVDLALNAEQYQKKWSVAKTAIKEAFVPKPEESPQAATFRIMRNIALASVGVAVLAGACVFLHHFVTALLAAKAAGDLSVWNITQFLPAQTSLMVFLEYASLGLAHGVMAIKKFQEGKKGEALFHSINTILGFFFPYYYFFFGHEPMRIHHSFLGLLLSLAPLDTLRLLGSMITLDSLSYVFRPFQGYWSQNRLWNRWDFQNLLLEHPAAYFGIYATTASIEKASKDIL